MKLMKKTVDAVTAKIAINGSEENPWSVIVSGDLGTDIIPISYIGSDGSLTAAYNKDGKALELTKTNPNISFDFSCDIAVVKGVTANAIGIDIFKRF